MLDLDKLSNNKVAGTHYTDGCVLLHDYLAVKGGPCANT
jgi:hypothetical protein